MNPASTTSKPNQRPMVFVDDNYHHYTSQSLKRLDLHHIIKWSDVPKSAPLPTWAHSS